MISDEKFYDRAETFALVQNVANDYFTLAEYRDKVKDKQTDKHDKVIWLYSNNPVEHDTYIQACKNRDYDVLVFDTIIDNHFLQHLEYKLGDVTFVRVDSDTVENLVQKDEKPESVLSEKEEEKVKELFEDLVKNAGGSIVLKALTPEDQPVQITRPEFMRRMKEMQALQGMSFDGLPDSYNVVVNTNHPLIASKLLKMRSPEKKEEVVHYLFNLARLNQNMLKGAELTEFINRSLKLVTQ